MKYRRPTKRTSIIIAISAVFVLLAGLYTWQSLRAWSAYETRLSAEQATFEQLRTKALSGKTTNERLEAIRTLDDKLSNRSELCRINAIYAWQAIIIPPLREGVNKCEAKVRQLGLVADPLKALREYLEASAKVQDIIKGLSPGEALTESNWVEKGLERARKARTELKQLSVAGDVAKLKEQAAKLSDTLVVTWESLIKANDAKDKSGYLSASAALAKAYADFMSLADTADAQIQGKVEALNKAANEL